MNPLGQCELQVANRSVFVINIRGGGIVGPRRILRLIYVNQATPFLEIGFDIDTIQSLHIKPPNTHPRQSTGGNDINHMRFVSKQCDSCG